MYHIDLNADLGEGFGIYRCGADEALLPLVTSANIACGWHGGDPSTIRRAVVMARNNGVAIGAHPGYPDLMGFGRRYMAMAESEITDGILYQLGGLDGLCLAEGMRISYVKPHGALYNAAAKDPTIARAIVEGICRYGTDLAVMCPAGSALARAAESAGLKIVREFFADRGYRDDGSLVPRGEPGALLSDEDMICDRILQAIKQHCIKTATGAEIPVSLDSICLHGDNPSAVDLARRIRKTLDHAGVTVCTFVESRK